jgi:putative acetyltransferase
MFTVKRTNGNDADLRELVMQLDKFLWSVYNKGMEYYGRFNYVDADHEAIVIYNDNKPVGCGCLRKVDADTAEVKRMFVLPSERKKGIATLVLKELEKYAAELGYKKIILETGKSLTKAVQLYQKHQYQIMDNYGPYIGMDESVCMKKIIA